MSKNRGLGAVCDHERARRIVKLAAKQTKVPALKRWLELDEFGGHERRACELLEIGERVAREKGLSTARMDEEASQVIAFEAASAMLTHAKKSRKR